MTWQGLAYQIDFSVTDAGKRVASTKRRIRWYAILLLNHTYHVSDSLQPCKDF